MKRFRLIRSKPDSAANNMALDEKIFNQYLQDGIPSLRVYSWQSPSFTYGVSQEIKNEIDVARCSSDGIGISQRMTGGGILFHNDEITYSLVCAKSDVGEDKNTFVSYRQICRFLINFYASLGLKADFAFEAKGFKNKCAPHQLCSASREKYDIVIGGKKIGGNAQKRKREIVFQHGSIPISMDWEFARKYAPNLPNNISSDVTTLAEELKSIPEKQILEQKLIDAFVNVFDVCFTDSYENQIPPFLPFPKGGEERI